jgi:hypothetical protein
MKWKINPSSIPILILIHPHLNYQFQVQVDLDMVDSDMVMVTHIDDLVMVMVILDSEDIVDLAMVDLDMDDGVILDGVDSDMDEDMVMVVDGGKGKESFIQKFNEMNYIFTFPSHSFSPLPPFHSSIHPIHLPSHSITSK